MTAAERRAEVRALLLETAEQRYLDGRSIDISSLAAEHDVSRATAYRWLGDNDKLLSELLMIRTDKAFRGALGGHEHQTGPERIVGVMRDMLHHVARSEHVRALLDRDPKRTMTILASRAFPNQQAFIALIQALLEEEVGRGHLEPALDVHTLAYAIGRMAEAFLYADVVAGEQGDPDDAAEIIRLLLP